MPGGEEGGRGGKAKGEDEGVPSPAAPRLAHTGPAGAAQAQGAPSWRGAGVCVCAGGGVCV